jgi:hypothetical protein
VLATNNLIKVETPVTIAHLVNSQETPTPTKPEDVQTTPRTALLEDNSNLDNNNAMLAKLAQLDKPLLTVNAPFQDQPVLATSNTTKSPTNVITAVSTKSQEMDSVNKTLDAELTLKTATLEDKFNSDNNHASHANHAQLDKTLSVTNAKYQDQFAIATKSMTKVPTNAETAHSTKSQEMESTTSTVLEAMPDKTSDAQFSPKTATLEDKYNLDNNNASDAKHAQLDKTLSVTNAKYQDQFATATNNTIKQETPVTAAQSVNFQETELLDNKMEDAKSNNKTAMATTQFNLVNNNAMLVKHAQLDKSSLETDALLELPALAINNSTLPPTLVATVQMVSLQMVSVDNAKASTLVATNQEEFNWPNNNAINAKTAQLDNNSSVTDVSYQDQIADATKSSTKTTNAKHALLDN